MASIFDLLANPGAVLGALVGLCVALVFHWLAPAGTDTVAAGAWFVGGGTLVGLAWLLLVRKRDKTE
jgi:hypothetical protein